MERGRERKGYMSQCTEVTRDMNIEMDGYKDTRRKT